MPSTTTSSSLNSNQQSSAAIGNGNVALSTAARGPLHLPATAAVAAAAASLAASTAAATRRPSDSDSQSSTSNSNSNNDNNNNNSNKGWLVTSCDVGTAEPQSLSEELDRLQVLKSYHVMDPEREEAFDRLTSLAARVLDTPSVFLGLVDMGRIWFRCNPESDTTEEQLTRDMLGCVSRVILKQSDVFVIPDVHLDANFRQQPSNNQQQHQQQQHSSQPPPQQQQPQATPVSTPVSPFRFFAGAPLMSPEGYRLGAFCVIGADPRPGGITEEEKENLKDFADLAVKSMVDRRALTMQGNPSHLVACTAHDLITPLTGIQLSLSLLQQDADFQAKLGVKRKEFISGAIRSSNMMLRICQSTIETLRGNQKIPSSTDWSLPRNLMQIAEASPFIDMKEFVANLEAISNSIPKRAPLKIVLHPAAPTNIVSDGLKIFRAALNLLSNACSRTEAGFITMTIQNDQDGSLLFECEDTGKDVEIRESHALFSHDSTPSNFGLYSVAYQVSWLGGKYGVRKRDNVKASSSGDLLVSRASAAAFNGNARARGLNVGTAGGILSSSSLSSTTRSSMRHQGGSGSKKPKNDTGAIFWFSVPIVLPQDVSELMGLAKSLTDENHTGVPTFQAELPTTPPASPRIMDSFPEEDSQDIPIGVVINKGETKRVLNVLIIEDSTTVRKILGRALSKMGYRVFEAVDGMEGLRELKITLFDMVLCDFLMPVMDGLDCIQQYREWEVSNRQGSFQQYIIGISAHASKKDIERGMKLGMDDFKPKPIVLKTLTGLHESTNLRSVRSKLDNLLNLPSLEVKQVDPVDTSHLSATASEMVRTAGSANSLKNGSRISPRASQTSLFSLAPKRASSPKRTKSALFSIATNLVESERRKKSAPLFSIAITDTNSAQTVVAKKPALFSIATNLTKEEPKKPALFSIATRDETKKPPLLSVVPETATKTAENTAVGKEPALFAIPKDRKPSALFSIGDSTIRSKSQEKAPALFSLATDQTVKPAPLFALAGTVRDSNEQRAAPLFALAGNAGESNEKKVAPLFSIAGNTRESSKKKVAPLFALAGNGSVDNEKKVAPLFALAGNTSVDNEKKVAPLFALAGNASVDNGKKVAPLFTLAGNASVGDEKKVAPLFALAGNASVSNETKVAPLFALTGNASVGDKTKVAPLFSVNESKEKKLEPLFAIPVATSKSRDEAQPTVAPLFIIPDSSSVKNAPLFSISSSTTLEQGNTHDDSAFAQPAPKAPLFALPGSSGKSETKPPPLFSISSSLSVENATKIAPLFSISPSSFSKSDSEEKTSALLPAVAKAPALFDINGSTSKPQPLFDIQGGGSTADASQEVTNNKPNRKRPLFDISMRSSSKKK